MSAHQHPLIIRAGDTDTIEIPVTPSWALEGARVRAQLWLGKISDPSWSHSWDTLDGVGIEIVGGTIRLSTGGADWLSAPRDRALEMTLEVELSRGGSVQTLPHYPVRVLPQAILTPPTPPEPSPPIDGTLTEVWVDGDAGSDLATGTEDDPVRTLARALELLAESDSSVVYVRPATEPYDGSVFARSLNRTGNTSFVAVGDWVEEVAPFAVGASAGVELVASTDLGWTENAFPLAGQFLEVVSSSDADLVGQRRNITRNTSDRLWLGHSLSKAVPAGTVVRVVSPPVVVSLGGTFFGGLGRGALFEFDGFDFVCDSPFDPPIIQADTLALHGLISCYGCRFSGNLGDLFLRSDSGYLWAGGYELTTRAGNGIAVLGSVTAQNTYLSGVFVCRSMYMLGGGSAELLGLSALGAANGLTSTVGHGGWVTLGSVAFYAGRPKAPAFLSGTTRWLDVNGNGIVRIRTRVEQIVTSTEARIGERSHLNTQNPDLLVTAGVIRVQEASSYRINGTPAINSPPGGGFIVGEPSFQVAVPDLDHESLTPKGRLVNPVDGSRIYWAAPEPA